MMRFQIKPLVLHLIVVVGCHVVGTTNARLSPVEALDALLDSSSHSEQQQHHHQQHEDQAALVRGLSSLTGAQQTSDHHSEPLSFLDHDDLLSASSPRNLQTCPVPDLPSWLHFGTYWSNKKCVNHFGFDYGWKMNGCQEGTYSLNSPDGWTAGSCDKAGDITITVVCNSDNTASISWTGLGNSRVAIKVKAGHGGKIYDTAGSSSLDNLGGHKNWWGNYKWISHIEFCVQCGEDCEPPPPPPAPQDPWTWGDPHFRTWHGKNEFEYHGECDLVFLKAPALDMDIHIRTTIRYDYSFVSQVVVRIGEDIFEVASWGEYQLNGMATVDLPNFMGSYPITGHKEPHRNKYRFKILLDPDTDMSVSIVSFKDYVSVKIENGDPTMFAGSYGIMGDYETGSLYSRDGIIMSDPQEFAPEWQVRPDEDGVLFSGDRYPQYPQQCVLPSPTAFHARKLGEATVNREQAEAACASWKTERASCIQDVLKTNDLEIALMHEDV